MGSNFSFDILQLNREKQRHSFYGTVASSSAWGRIAEQITNGKQTDK
jgi:hypothetical protein